MSHVKSKDSKIEILFRKELCKRGLKYRKNSSKHFGKPDIFLSQYRTVIFIDSCFWHGCKRHCRIPSVRKKFWTMKISGNKRRDKKVSQYYNNINWKIVRIWEHDLKKKNFKFDAKKIKYDYKK